MRDLFVLDIPTGDDLPTDLSLPSRHFVCLIAWDARNATNDEIAGVALGLLEQGAAYVCAWGPDCERVHDIIDEERAGPNPPADVSDVVMTTWHEDESLAEAIRFALVCAWPDECYAESCKSLLGVAIGSSSWAAEIRAAFSSPEQFVQRLDAET